MQTQLQQQKPTGRQLAVGLLLALPLGLLAPGLYPALLLGPAMLTFLFAYAGIVPMLVSAAAQLLMCDAIGGLPIMAAGLLASLLPAAAAARGIRWRRPFFAQMRADIAVHLVGVLAALLVIYLNYGNIVARLVEVFRAQLGNYPGELTELIAGRFADIEALLAALEQNLILRLPGMLLSGAILGGVLMAAWPNWLLRRRGQATAESYVPLAQWRVPGSVVAGVLGMLLASLCLYFAGMAGGDSVFSAVRSVCDACFLLQALGSLARLAERANISRGWRNVLLALALTILQTVAVYLGCFSALLGSRGLITEIIRRRKDDDRQ